MSVAGRPLPGAAASVASKERPAAWNGPAILLSDQDALRRLLFRLPLSNLIGLRLARASHPHSRGVRSSAIGLSLFTNCLMIMGLVAAETRRVGLR